MKQINLNRQLLGIEDLLFGFGQVTQNRAGQSVNITKINVGSLPFDETQSLLQWTQNVNLAELGAMTTELQALYNSLDALNNLEDNLVALNILAQAINCLNNLCNNLTKLQNIDINMTKLQNIDTNITKLQNIDTNMTKLQNIDTNMTKLSSIYSNMSMLQTVYDNMSSLNAINSQIIPHLSEILLVDDYAAQVSADKTTVANDKASVASMKLAVETIYDTFDDRFLGTKTSDPTLDNDGNPLLDGAMYFNTSVNALKVYDLGNSLWVAIPQIYLSGLLDVTLTSITTGDILTWNGSKWINTRTPSFDSIKLNGGTGTNGIATWNNAEYTYDIVLNPNVTLQVGQEDLVYCKNNTASVIANGRPVMAVGTNGNSGNILVDLHDGTKANARRIVGIATEDLTANGYGFVTRNGKVRGINTTGSQYGEAWVDGDILYVKATGNLTNVEPADTALKMPIAFVIHAHTNGTLYVRTTGIDENHDRDLIATKADLNNPKFTNNIGFGGLSALSNWSSLKVMEGNGGIFFGSNGISALTGSNTYYDGTWKYKDAGSAGLQLVNQGSHQFKVATTGVADGTITWNTTANIDATGLNVLSGTNSLPGYGFLSDTDTGIYNPSANTLGLVTGGSERMRIDTEGNVGIGTTTINNKLEVNGSIGFGSTTGNGRIYSDVNWGCLLQSNVSSPAVAEFAFLNNTGAQLAIIDTSGNLLLKSGNGGLGYGTGAGGTVTQLTSKSTAVTLNKPTGQITMNNAALAAGATTSFTLTNSLITTTDTIIVNCYNFINYRVEGRKIGSGACTVSVTNVSTGSLSEAIVLNFAVIKGATA